MPEELMTDTKQAQPETTLIMSIYALQAAAVVLGILIIIFVWQPISHLVGLIFISAVVLNYVKRKQFVDTWLASHAKWQRRTFWYTFLWTLIGIVSGFFFGLSGLVFIAYTVWLVYRVAKGWLRLHKGQEMYTTEQLTKAAT